MSGKGALKVVGVAGQLALVAAGLLALLFGTCGFAYPWWFSLGGLPAWMAVLNDPGTQWMIFAFLCLYFVMFWLIRLRAERPPGAGWRGIWQAGFAGGWLAAVMAAGTAVYAWRYPPTHAPGNDALVWLAGAVAGQALAVWAARWRRRDFLAEADGLRLFLVATFIAALALAQAIKPGSSQLAYHEAIRRTGPWNNPNEFGLLTGAGSVLALGLGVRFLTAGWVAAGRLWLAAALLCLLAAALLWHGLMASYSRGAWVGTAAGTILLLRRLPRPIPAGGKICVWPGRGRPERGHGLALLALALGLATLAFWHFLPSASLPARRACSIVDPVDFSWRNRVAAWEGALQIVAEHPLWGAGWNQPQRLYEYYYLPPKLIESGAIVVNDYLTLAATLGWPAVGCLAVYLWLKLGRRLILPEPPGIPHPADWLGITCLAGAFVLLTGFWFDGGWFNLATGSAGWMLLETGSGAARPEGAEAGA